MTQTFDLMIRNATVWTPAGPVEGDLGARDGKTAAIVARGVGDAAEVIDGTGLMVLPGVIDTQVHFREPGLEHKEDLASGSLAAVLGGVTAVFEMPNTRPNTDSAAALADKLARARGRMWCDHAFYVGATAANADDLAELEMLPGACGVKVFMGASTGDLLVYDDETLARVLRHGRRRVAIHAEDEYRMRDRANLRVAGEVSSHPVWRDDVSAMLATRRAVRIAEEVGRRVHILHVTTPAELEFLSHHRDIATAEVTPQHLTLAGEDAYPRLGSHAQMNPPIRSGEHRDGLWYWLGQGVGDVIGSDHAPHTLAEKAGIYPDTPSGMPGVQTLLPLLLNRHAEGRISLSRLVDLTSAGAERVFNLQGKGRIAKGYDADWTIVDLKRRWTIGSEWLASRCGWSPFEGMELTGAPVGTIIRGRRVMWEAETIGAAAGEPIRFQETLQPAMSSEVPVA